MESLEDGAGAIKDYSYSNAVKNSEIIWTAENLDKWLKDPEKLIPGQIMSFSVDNVKDRADIIAYLMTVTKQQVAKNKTE